MSPQPESNETKPTKSLVNASLRSLSDHRLVALCLLNAPNAWDVLIDRYAPLIYTVARRAGLSDADAQDIFQEASLTLLENLGAVRDVERLSSWLISVTRRAVWKMRQRRHTPAFSESASEEWMLERAQPLGKEAPASTEEAVEKTELQWRARNALEQLGEPCRTLLRLLYCQEPPCEYAEVSERLKMPMNSISPTRIRCLQRLKKNLSDWEE